MNFLNILGKLLIIRSLKYYMNNPSNNSAINTTNNLYHDDKLKIHFMLGTVI